MRQVAQALAALKINDQRLGTERLLGVHPGQERRKIRLYIVTNLFVQIAIRLYVVTNLFVYNLPHNCITQIQTHREVKQEPESPQKPKPLDSSNKP